MGTIVRAGAPVAVALVLGLGATACGSASAPTAGPAGSTSGPVPTASFDRRAPYRFATTASDAQVTDHGAFPTTTHSEGAADPTHKIAIATTRDSPIGRGHDPFSSVYAHGTTYEPLASWLKTNFLMNPVQMRILGGRRWVHNPGPSGPGESSTFSVDALVGGSPFAGAFDVLGGFSQAHVAVRRLGTAVVRGVATTHYRALHDTAVRYSKTAGTMHESFDVWVDRTGRLRRIHAVVHSPEGDDSPPSIDDWVTDYFDVGQPVHITVPAPSEAADGHLLSLALVCTQFPHSRPNPHPEPICRS